MVPPSMDIKSAYAKGKDEEQKFVQNLSLFFCTFLKEHGQLIEAQHQDLLMGALNGLLLISEVDDVEIFKICLEYWNTLAANLYHNCNHNISNITQALGLPSPNMTMSISSRLELYRPVLSSLRYIIIGRMAKPEEVLVVENEQGEVVREFMKDTDAIQLYKSMRETLVYLTNLDCPDTERIMTEKLQNQVNGTEWSWKNLNTVSFNFKLSFLYFCSRKFEISRFSYSYAGLLAPSVAR